MIHISKNLLEIKNTDFSIFCFSQTHNVLHNGYYPPKQQPIPNQPKRPTKPNTDPNTLLTTAPIPNQQITSNELKTKTVNAPEDEEDEDEDEDEEDDDDEEEEDSDEESSDSKSSDRFSIKSDLAQINEESSKARRTPLLYIRPHLRAKFVFDQLIQVLPQSPSDTNQPATVEIHSANVKILSFLFMFININYFFHVEFTFISAIIN